MAYILGLDCTLTVDSVEITHAKDVTLNVESGDADVTTRASNGWREHMPTLLDATIEFELLTGGADATKLASLFNSGDAALVEAGSDNFSFSAKMIVANFSGSQPLEDAESVSVSLRLAPLDDGDDPPEMEAGSAG